MATIKCPNCSSEFVRRVARLGMFEVLLSYIYFYPFRCQLCGYRFRFLEWGVRYLRVEEDKRTYDRLPMNFPVAFTGDKISGQGTVQNLSMGGCSIVTDTKIERGTILNLALSVSKEITPMIVEAAVVRYVRPENFGVEFLRWQSGERERLQLFVRGLLINRQS